MLEKIKEMTSDEIDVRLAEIRSLLNDESADIDALTAEVDAMEQRKAELKEMAEKRAKTEELINNNINVEIIEEVKSEERTKMEKIYGLDSAEYRSAFLKKVRGIELSEVEKRAYTSAAGSAGAALPTETANEIIKKMAQYAPLLGEVTLLHVAGNVKFAIEDTINPAAKHSENGSISSDADTLTSVTLGSYEITKLIQVSKTVATMSIDAFEAWLVDLLAQKVAEKIDAYLVNGTGSSQPTGVEKAQTWGATNSVTVAKASSTTAANVQELIGLLNGGYDRNAKFLMTKKTLFTEFMPLQDNAKNKLVTVEGKDYFIYGYPVMLDDNVADKEAYLGDFKKIVANLSEEINVVNGFDIDTNSYKYLGCAQFDSKVAVGEAFVKLVKATS